MAGVGEPSGEEAVAYLVDDLAARDHGAERDIARVDPLRDTEDVGHDVPVLACKPLPRPPESGHHLVEDQEDPVAVADLANALQVAVGRHDDAVRAGDGLEDDRRDGVRTFVLENLLQMRCARADRTRFGMSRRAAIGVRVERPHDARHAGLHRPATRIARQRDSAVGGAVVGAIARDDLVAAGDHARELDRVLVRLRAAVREERHGQVARRHLRQHPAQLRSRLVRHRGADRAELVGLVLDRLDDLRVLVADVDVDELRGEVEVAIAVVVPEVAPLGAGDRDRVDRVLHRPRVEDVLLGVGDDLRAQSGFVSIVAIALAPRVAGRHDRIAPRRPCRRGIAGTEREARSTTFGRAPGLEVEQGRRQPPQLVDPEWLGAAADGLDADWVCSRVEVCAHAGHDGILVAPGQRGRRRAGRCRRLRGSSSSKPSLPPAARVVHHRQVDRARCWRAARRASTGSGRGARTPCSGAKRNLSRAEHLSSQAGVLTGVTRYGWAPSGCAPPRGASSPGASAARRNGCRLRRRAGGMYGGSPPSRRGGRASQRAAYRRRGHDG